MDDQVIRLILQTKGQESIDNLRKSTDNYKSLLEQLVTSYAKGDVTAEEFERQQKQLGNELERQTALLRRLETAAESAGTAQHTLTGKTGSAETSTKNMGQAALQAGRALQDLAQGGIGGILNNIEGLSVALGGGAGLAGILTAVGIAAMFAGPALKAMGDAMRGATESFPPKDRLDGLEKSLKGVRDQVEELTRAQKGTNADVAEYNRLIAEEAKLEAQLDKERDARNAKKRVDALQPSNEDAKRRADSLQKAFGDPADRAELEREIKTGLPTDRLEKLRDEARRANAAAQQALTDDPLNLVGMNEILGRRADAARQAVAQELKRRQEEASRLMVELIDQSRKETADRVRDLVSRSPTSGYVLAQIDVAEKEAAANSPAAKAEAAARKAAEEKAKKDAEDQAKKDKKAADDRWMAQAETYNAALDETPGPGEAERKRNEAERTKKIEADAKATRDQRTKAFGSAVADRTMIDEAAAQEAAMMRQNGFSDDQIERRLQRLIAQAIRQFAPRADRQLVGDTASQMAAQATQQSVGALLNLGQSNVDLTGQTVGMMGEFMGTLQVIGQQQAELRRQLAELQRGNRQVQVSTLGPNGGR